MYIAFFIGFILMILLIRQKLLTDYKIIFITSTICILTILFIKYSDYCNQIVCNEIWSGTITDVQHKEEWDEWIPEKEETYEEEKIVNKKKVKVKKTRIIPGHYKHHKSSNWLVTSDNGKMYITKDPNGKHFDDNYPNKTEELYKFWKVGDPSASIHYYENKIKASYSLYKNKDIDLSKYLDLPEYPLTVTNCTTVERIIGNVPNKSLASNLLNKKNSLLNRQIKDKDGEYKSYKQVNLIFVNVGDKPDNYGFALQDYWKNGNKNDFIVCFSMDKNNNIKWVYPFSWSESELLKLHVKDYMLNLKSCSNFAVIVENVSDMVEKEFIRKEFKDFNYLQIPTSKGAVLLATFIIILVILGAVYIEYERR